MSTPRWVANAVFYAIMPDRFAHRAEAGPAPWSGAAFEPWDAPPQTRSYKGGNLGGITERLDHLVELGVTALLMTPIFLSQSYHRYKPVSFFEVDPMLGGDAAFDELLAAAHDRGLRVVLDGVFNHVSWGFPPFLDVLENGARSPWRDWFLIEGWPLCPFEDAGRPANYKCWNGKRSMPELNHAHPAVREFVLTIAEHWVRRGIDGWRFDCPAAVGDRAFWRELRTRVRHIDPDVYLLGEIWTDAAQWLDGTQWDGVTNYPLMSALHRFVGGERIIAERMMHGASKERALDAGGFAHAVEELLAAVPWDNALAQLNFLNSADTPRFRTLVGDDAATVELGALLLFTLPGAPCILYGEEVGLQGGADPDNRRGFPQPGMWNTACLSCFRGLAGLRRTHPALCEGGYRTVLADGSVLAFERALKNERLLIAVNAGETASSVALPEGEPARGELLFGDGALDGRLVLPGRRGAVWQL